MIRLNGKGVSPGCAAGRLYIYRKTDIPVINKPAGDPQSEWERFKAAQAKAVAELGELAEKARETAGEDAALLFETHQMMAEDEDYEDAVRSAIDEKGASAEGAVAEASDMFSSAFAAMDDEYMQARSADVTDISNRILAALSGAESGRIVSDTPVILAADDLSPSQTVQLDKSKILGIITRRGSASGHTAILARTLGIPAVIGAEDILNAEYENRETIIYGDSGEVLIDPDRQARMEFSEKTARQNAEQLELESVKGRKTVSPDGKTIKLYCNIGSPDDLRAVEENDGEGIGLFRSEFLYLGSSGFPSEEEQFEAYKKVLLGMNGREVIIRTLDIGADKQISYFAMEKEENPALGKRALRICLERPDIFLTQLRALLRASAYGSLGIMFPMVTSVWEVREARALLEKAKQELAGRSIPTGDNVKVGIMIETPAAVLISDMLAKEVDFFSIGTNDLTQYTLACDRQNPGLGRFCDTHHPAVLRAIGQVCENAHKNGVTVGICGELGADPTLTGLFLSMGIDELSVNPKSVLPLRKAIISGAYNVMQTDEL